MMKFVKESPSVTKGGGAVSGYVLHLPKEESIIIPGAAARLLIEGGNSDSALAYLALLRNKGSTENLAEQLRWPVERLQKALGVLARQGLIDRAVPAVPVPPAPPAAEERPEYTRADMARAMEGAEFAALVSAVEDKLGKKLTTPDLAALLGLYDQLGIPADVIFLLVGFCVERTALQGGKGRRLTMRQIEKEGYTWARLGLMDQGSASAYINRYHRSREALPRLMALLRLGDRQPSPSEERYLLGWNEMGFDSEVIELAYDKTILKCKELRWAYMDKILKNWHQKGLHTLKEVNGGDRPKPRREAPRPTGPAGQNEMARDEMARMEKYLQQLRGKKEGG